MENFQDLKEPNKFQQVHRIRKELNANILDLIIYVSVLVYTRNGRFIVTCVLYFR